MILTIFSIIISTGIGSHLYFVSAFAYSNSQSESHDQDMSSNSSKTNSDQFDPFNSNSKNLMKINENIILPDIVGSDNLQGSSSAPSSQYEPQSKSVLQSENNSNNQDMNILISNNTKSTVDTSNNAEIGLASTDSQLSTDDNVINSNQNAIENVIVSDDKSILSDDKPNNLQSSSQSQSMSQSELIVQPKYKSYRDFMIKNNISLGQENINFKQETEGANSTTKVQQVPTRSNATSISNNNNELTDMTTDNFSAELSSTSTSEANSQSSQAQSSNNADSPLDSISKIAGQSGKRIYGDFNGDGFDDLAIGSIFEDVGSKVDAGAVQVIYGSGNGLSANSPIKDQFWTQDSSNVDGVAESADGFGRSLASGDFNGDGKDDLAIGVIGEDLAANPGVTPIRTDAGIVQVIYGSSPAGLSATAVRADQLFAQGIGNVNDNLEPNDRFGLHLTTGDFNGDGNDELAIGVPFESVAGFVSAGGVEVIYGSSNGLSTTSPKSDQFWTQNSGDIEDGPEQNDVFGSSITSGDFNNDGKDDLAIGVQLESVSGVSGAGGVEVIYGSSNGLSATSPLADQFFVQGSHNINGISEHTDRFGSSLASGDFNQDGKDDLAVGISEKDVTDLQTSSTIENAGSVAVIYGSSPGGLSATAVRADQLFVQGMDNVNDKAEVDDAFGRSLVSGDFNNDGKEDLAIGVENEIVNGIFAGGVEVIYGSPSGLSATVIKADQFWHQDSLDINDSAENNDHFGQALGAGDFNGDGEDDLAIGVPGESVSGISGAGGVEVIYGSPSGLSATSPRADQFWTQNNINSLAGTDRFPEQFDGFGGSLG